MMIEDIERKQEPGNEPNIKTLDLSKQNISEFQVPDPEDNDYEELIINFTEISQLPSPMPNVKTVRLISDCIRQISPDILSTLESYENLIELDLSSNYLKKIKSEFRKMKKLETLSLTFNRLTEIRLKSKSVINLDISQNRLTSIPKIPKQVRTLNISYNLFKTLESKTKLSHLTSLSISLVGLESIDPELKLPKLEILDISMNKLSQLPDLTEMTPNLIELNASNNFLKKMPEMPISITTISIEFNEISTLPDLTALTNLSSLNISYNQIETIPQIPESLEFFDFSNNYVATIAPANTPNLKRLIFASNRLKTCPPYNASEFLRFAASHNFLTTVDHFESCNRILRLELEYNNLTEIPNSIMELTYIQSLYLSNNKIKKISKKFSKIKGIGIFQITSNPLKALPQLSSTLVYLYAGYCEISKLPNLSNYKRLAILCMPGNKISKIPKLPESLKSIWLSRNSISAFPVLPQSIEQVDLSYNLIKTFPQNLCLSNLEELDLTHNLLTSFPSNFVFPALHFIRLGSNPISAQFDSSLFSGCEIGDFTETKIVFQQEPNIRQFFVSEKLPQYVSRHCRQFTTHPWLQYSETKGTRAKMEDSVILKSFVVGDVDLYSIFDGHTGNSTSTYSALFFDGYFENPKFSQTFELTKKCVYNITNKLISSVRSKRYNDGTTMALAFFNGKKLVTSHIGDTRILVIRQDGTISFSTTDHKATSRGEFERIHMDGGKVMNFRLHGVLAPGRTLGDFYVPANRCEADIYDYAIKPNDKWIVIACDGIFDVLSNQQIGELSKSSKNAGELAADIRNLSYSNCSTDNLSVIAVDIMHRVVPPNVTHINDSYEDDEIPPIVINESFDDIPEDEEGLSLRKYNSKSKIRFESQPSLDSLNSEVSISNSRHSRPRRGQIKKSASAAILPLGEISSPSNLSNLVNTPDSNI